MSQLVDVVEACLHGLLECGNGGRWRARGGRVEPGLEGQGARQLVEYDGSRAASFSAMATAAFADRSLSRFAGAGECRSSHRLDPCLQTPRPWFVRCRREYLSQDSYPRSEVPEGL